LTETHPAPIGNKSLTEGSGLPVAGIIAQESDDPRDEAYLRRGVVALPVDDGGFGDAELFGHLLLQESQIKSSLAEMIAERV